MNPDSAPCDSKWRYQTLARSVSLELQRRHGRHEYYLPEHVDAACTACGLSETDKVYAVAMFVAPNESEGILQRLRSSKTTDEIRKFLATQMIFGPSVSVDFEHYGFHDAGSRSSDSFGSDSGGFHGGDSGGSGGDGGGD
jgi:hypothetical protein